LFAVTLTADHDRMRRAPGEGSIRKRKDGRWEGSVTIGHTERGNPKRRVVYGRTRAAVVAKLDALKGELSATGTIVAPSSMTVAQFLERWVESRALRARRSTVDNYRTIVAHYIAPAIGERKLQKLEAVHVQTMLAELAARRVVIANQRTRREAERTVSARMVRYVHLILRMALGDAVKWGVLRRNSAALLEPPRVPRFEPSVWSQEAVVAFVAHAAGSRYHAAYLLALTAGLRRGELLGLRVSDLAPALRSLTVRRAVTLSGGTLAEGEPKGGRRRTIHLDGAVGAALETRLEALWRERDEALEAGLWRGGPDPYVFGSTLGTPTHPRNLARDFTAVCRRAGVPRIRLHDLRHTYGSHAVARLSLPDLSARLGHTDPSFTARVYTHPTPGAAERAALTLDELYGEPDRDAVTMRSNDPQSGGRRRPN